MTTDNFNPPNSVWPNGLKRDEEGYVTFYPLGTNKVKVPTSSSEWPKGNKLVSPFVYQDDKLVGFVDTKALTTDSQTVTYLPYKHIEAEFSAIDKGQLQIYAPNATTKKASWKDSGVEDIPSEVQFKYKGCTTIDNVKTVDVNYTTTDIVNGVWSEPLWDLEQGTDGNWASGMFFECTALTAFSSDLPSLTDGSWMFGRCKNLTSFSSNLSSLRFGDAMFAYCENLSEFDTDLPNLTDGSSMFYGTNLTSFSSDLHNLTNGDRMFDRCSNLSEFSSDLPSLTNGSGMLLNCSALTAFSSDLTSLTDGSWMFNGTNLTTFKSNLSSLRNGSYMFLYCSKLESFSSDLSSLTNGYDMFNGCSLDTASVQNIADTINTYKGTIHIGIGNKTPNEQEETAFNKMVSKGWTVYVNGSDSSDKWNPTSLTPIDGEETVTPIPFWAKPVQSDEEHAQYVDEQGNFFIILGGQFIYGDDLSTYGMFTCEEDAAANMCLTPYIKTIENQ